MSEGRPALGFEAWQDLMQAARGIGRLEQAVAERTGKRPLVNVTEEALEGPDVLGGSRGMMRPADASLRMTQQEFRAEVRRQVKIRRREWAEVVDMVLSDQEPPQGHYVRPEVVAGIQILAAQVARELRAEMAPERPRKTRKPKPMRPRTRGESSPVVVHSPGSKWRDANGVELSPFEAASLLSEFDPYAVPSE